MARFRNTVNGVVMSIDDNAPMLPGSWVPLDEEPAKKTPARKRTSRKTEAPDANSDAPGPDDE